MIDPTQASSAYLNTSGIKTGGGGAIKNEGVNFSDFLRDKAQSSADTLKAGEVMSAKAITGDAEITAVVEAVTAAETTLNTVIALRDRMIGAYQEIMRMPI